MNQTIRLEVGKRYRNGTGEIVRIEEYDAKKTRPYMGDDGIRYLPDGRWSDEPHVWDLVSEVPDDPDPKWEALIEVLWELSAGNESARHAITRLERALDEEGTRL